MQKFFRFTSGKKVTSYLAIAFMTLSLNANALDVANSATGNDGFASFSGASVVTDDSSLYQDRAKIMDPFEPVNRGIFHINSFLDMLLIKPLAYAYRDLVPLMAQDRVSSFLANLRAPVIFVNDLLQGEFKQSMNTLVRFLMNSTFGFFGLLDVASHAGLKAKDNSFDKTFQRWGIASGPYIMLPLLGPSSFRDLVGDIIEAFVDPYNWYMRNNSNSRFLGRDGGGPIFARAAVSALVSRARALQITEKLDKTEDPYAQYRLLYMQNRLIIDAIEESAIPSDVIKE